VTVSRLGLGLGCLLALCWLAGCPSKKKKRRPQAALGKVTVLERGGEPRHRLRYRYQRGETLRYRLTSRRRLTGVPGGERPVTAELSVHTARVDGRRARLRWQIERVQGAPLQRTPLWIETSDRGEISAVRQRFRPGRARGGRASGKPVRQSVRQLYLAWPEPAVGPGARWEQRRDLILAASVQGGVRARVHASYTFDRVARCGQGRCAYLSVRTRLDARQRAGRVKVRGKGGGTGRVVFDLDKGRLMESSTRADLGLGTSLQPGETVQRLRLEQSLKLIR
jgi:hypothetical protein